MADGESNERITVTMRGGVADVKLVRTDKMNALDDAMFSALIETGERLKADKSVRAVVLSGEGRAHHGEILREVARLVEVRG